MEFSNVIDEVLAAYADGAYRRALEVVSHARPQFPERDASMTFWVACLHSRAGEPEIALQSLAEGLDRGLAWHPKMLADTDLEAVRELDGWASFAERSTAVVASWRVERPPPLLRAPAEPLGTVIALHGAGHVPEDFQSEWVTAIPVEWAVVAPIGDVPLSNEAWAWPYDLSTDSLEESLASTEIAAPVVLAGFSQGAGIAARAAWNGVVDAIGLIMSAGTVPSDIWTGSARRSVPTYAVVGTEDGAYPTCSAMAKDLERDGVPVFLDVREGMGHVAPPDLDIVIRSALDWFESV